MRHDNNDYRFRKNIFGDITEVYDIIGNYLGGYSYDTYGKTTLSNPTISHLKNISF